MTQGNIFNSFAQIIQGGHAMKDRFRFWGLYLGLILSFVLHDITIENLWESLMGTFWFSEGNNYYVFRKWTACNLLCGCISAHAFPMQYEKFQNYWGINFSCFTGAFITCNRQYYDKSFPLGVYEFVILYSIRCNAAFSIFVQNICIWN